MHYLSNKLCADEGREPVFFRSMLFYRYKIMLPLIIAFMILVPPKGAVLFHCKTSLVFQAKFIVEFPNKKLSSSIIICSVCLIVRRYSTFISSSVSSSELFVRMK